MTENQNPAVGDRVRYADGKLAEVAGLGSMVTHRGPAVIYDLRFAEGPSVNCLREEFVFPIQREASI